MKLAISQIDNRYIILFQGGHECKHTKTLDEIQGYQFVYCKATKEPIALYCAKEIVNDDDALLLVKELGERFSMLHGTVESIYFQALSAALLDVDEITLT
jgi:hypothetical protein